MNEPAPTYTDFKVKDRIQYLNDSDCTGVITEVTPDGYRIKWDDGYEDEPNEYGCYADHELIREGEVS